MISEKSIELLVKINFCKTVKFYFVEDVIIETFISIHSWKENYIVSFLFLASLIQQCDRWFCFISISNFIIIIWNSTLTQTNIFIDLKWFFIYSAHRLIESRIIESAAYCNKILLVPLYLNSSQNTSVYRIIRLLLSFICWPKVIKWRTL